MRWVLAMMLLVLGCTSPVQEVFPVAERRVQARLDAEGWVEVAGERYDLRQTKQAAALGRALRAAAIDLPEEEPTLNLTAAQGTPFEHVQRLMAVLEAVGVEDYRLDRGR